MVQPTLPFPIAAALALVWRDGRTVLVRRSKVPDDPWGFPGGSVEAGEELTAAALRELFEETGITADQPVLWPAFSVMRRDGAGHVLAHYILHPVACRWRAGDGVAASDAASLCWVDREGAARLACHPDVGALLDRLHREFSHDP